MKVASCASVIIYTPCSTSSSTTAVARIAVHAPESTLQQPESTLQQPECTLQQPESCFQRARESNFRVAAVCFRVAAVYRKRAHCNACDSGGGLEARFTADSSKPPSGPMATQAHLGPAGAALPPASTLLPAPSPPVALWSDGFSCASH